MYWYVKKTYLSFAVHWTGVFKCNVILFRLSSIASAKLTYNNPNIADLSDRNRPQKLGEMFGELYDNEWTDAVDRLTDIMEEKKAIILLRDVLQYIYEKTKKASEDQYRNLQNALFQVIFENKNGIYSYFIRNCVFLRVFETNEKKLKSFIIFQRDLRNSEMKNFIPIYKKIGEMQKEVAAISIDNSKQVNRTQS